MKSFFALAARFTSQSARAATPAAAGKSFKRTRRGVAVLLVLGMLAMTLALCYASLRGQATVAKLAENLGRGEAARLAAESGVYDALRRMSDGTWAGVDTAFTANVNGSSWYEVSFATGDAQLTPADPQYGEFAYRVTITSVGYADDPGQPTVRAIHKVDAVVQLARRTLLAEPANWSTLTNFNVHQWGNRDVVVQEPVRIHGSASIQGRLLLSQEYPLTAESRQDFLEGLNDMRLDGRGDHRPFKSPLTIALLRQDASTLTELTTWLGLATVDTLAPNSAPAAHPISVTSYRLYPGGKSYSPPIIQTVYSSSLQNITIEPDPIDNPLGIYRSRNSLAINNNVNIRGTIISEGTTPDIQVHGTNVVLEAVNLAPLESTSQVYQLPVALIRDDLRFHDTSSVTINGLAMVYDEFDLELGAATASFNLTGHLFANGLTLHGRSPWVMTSNDWDADHQEWDDATSGGPLAALLAALLNTVRNLLGLGANDDVYFPDWMQAQQGFTVEPSLNFRPPTSGVLPHWHTWSQPVYQKDPADMGLRWNLIRWSEVSP